MGNFSSSIKSTRRHPVCQKTFTSQISDYPFSLIYSSKPPLEVRLWLRIGRSGTRFQA